MTSQVFRNQSFKYNRVITNSTITSISGTPAGTGAAIIIEKSRIDGNIRLMVNTITAISNATQQFRTFGTLPIEFRPIRPQWFTCVINRSIAGNEPSWGRINVDGTIMINGPWTNAVIETNYTLCFEYRLK